MKTITAALSKYSYKAQNIYLSLAAGTYDIDGRIKLRMPRVVFNGASSSASDVIINIKTDIMWASILSFIKVTVNVDVKTSLEGNRIDFSSDSILNLNENIALSSNAINMQGNTINLNDFWLRVSSGSIFNMLGSCTVNSRAGYIDVAGGIASVKVVCPVHVNGGGVLYYTTGITPVTTSPYVAVQFS